LHKFVEEGLQALLSECHSLLVFVDCLQEVHEVLEFKAFDEVRSIKDVKLEEMEGPSVVVTVER